MSRARDKPPDGTYRVAVFDSPAEFFSALRGAPSTTRMSPVGAAKASCAHGGKAAHADLPQSTTSSATWASARRGLAATHGYDTVALSREFHRFDSECFSTQPFARTRARQLRRAIEIACAHRGDEWEAAE